MKKLNDSLMIEIVIRKKNVDLDRMSEEFKDIIKIFKQIETNEKLVLDMPTGWDGFKNGTIINMLKFFNESMYVAIAYFTENDNEIITDLEGNQIDKYEEVKNGKLYFKYVKKKIRIIKILDKDSEIFEIEGYILDLKYLDPIIKVLEVYSSSKNSGLTLEQFNIIK